MHRRRQINPPSLGKDRCYLREPRSALGLGFGQVVERLRHLELDDRKLTSTASAPLGVRYGHECCPSLGLDGLGPSRNCTVQPPRNASDSCSILAWPRRNGPCEHDYNTDSRGGEPPNDQSSKTNSTLPLTTSHEDSYSGVSPSGGRLTRSEVNLGANPFTASASARADRRFG